MNVPFYLSPESFKLTIQHRTMSAFLDLLICCMLTWLPAPLRCLWAFYTETTHTHFSLYPLVCRRLRPFWHRRKRVSVKSSWPTLNSSALQLLISFHSFLFYSSFSKELNSRASASDWVSIGWFAVGSKTCVSVSLLLATRSCETRNREEAWCWIGCKTRNAGYWSYQDGFARRAVAGGWGWL